LIWFCQSFLIVQQQFDTVKYFGLAHLLLQQMANLCWASLAHLLLLQNDQRHGTPAIDFAEDAVPVVPLWQRIQLQLAQMALA
jgi:hypothetical protein